MSLVTIPSRSPPREVIGLGAAAGEDDLVRLRADRVRDLLARFVDQHARRPPLGIDARGIAMHIPVDLRHGGGDLGVHRRCRGVVEVDASHRPKV